ncbi:hypothetical protein [Streptomyces sp. GS7]|uniref:hypothetical protein n=1 Tax=Streptomyces sp. GS7 TaxID=2692234 RepID=UPI001317B149|nr:hypothetical protein [Streptomyces sp. GS7]QHC23078.1 hypothetical protein GR130_18355 [Streptomyces sp. GS7]
MSRNELERLAKIRMQITGESLERALAVLRGDTTEPAPDTDPGPGPTSEAEPELPPAPAPADAGNATAAPDTSPDRPEPPDPPDGTHPRRPHLRGL